jgi:hypothetical protein
MFLKQNICRLIAIRAKFISVLILVSTVWMLSGRQFEQLTIIISIARIQLILQLNRLRTAVDQLTRKIIIARMLSSNNKFVSSRFFEQTNFEQLIMTRRIKQKDLTRFNSFIFPIKYHFRFFFYFLPFFLSISFLLSFIKIALFYLPMFIIFSDSNIWKICLKIICVNKLSYFKTSLFIVHFDILAQVSPLNLFVS